MIFVFILMFVHLIMYLIFSIMSKFFNIRESSTVYNSVFYKNISYYPSDTKRDNQREEEKNCQYQLELKKI